MSSDETARCDAETTVNGYYDFACQLPAGHNGPHTYRLSLAEQSDPVTIGDVLEWTSGSEASR